MPYTKTTWADEVPASTPVKYIITDVGGGENTIQISTAVTAGTPINAANLNKIETGIETAQDTSESAETTANAAIPKSIVTTVGDLIYATASATLARFAKPSVDSFLKMTSAGVPGWIALSTAFQFLGRRGGDSADWSDGNPQTSYVPASNVFTVAGAYRSPASITSVPTTISITFPTAFSQKPIVISSPLEQNTTSVLNYFFVTNISTTGFDVAIDFDTVTANNFVTFYWLAIGE